MISLPEYFFVGYVVSMHALNGDWQDMDVSLNLNDDLLNLVYIALN